MRHHLFSAVIPSAGKDPETLHIAYTFQIFQPQSSAFAKVGAPHLQSDFPPAGANLRK
jgi:hypothetical protein